MKNFKFLSLSLLFVFAISFSSCNSSKKKTADMAKTETSACAGCSSECSDAEKAECGGEVAVAGEEKKACCSKDAKTESKKSCCSDKEACSCGEDKACASECGEDKACASKCGEDKACAAEGEAKSSCGGCAEKAKAEAVVSQL